MDANVFTVVKPYSWVPSLWLPLIIVLPLAGCGGGEGGFPHQQPGTSPSISNLTVAPISVMHHQGGGSVNVDISVNFIDQEGDVDYLGVNVLDSAGSILYVRGVSLPQLVGQHSGTAAAAVVINTDSAGQFTLRVWVGDQTIRSSNRLETQFSVI